MNKAHRFQYSLNLRSKAINNSCYPFWEHTTKLVMKVAQIREALKPVFEVSNESL
jgi:hypothetical protein